MAFILRSQSTELDLLSTHDRFRLALQNESITIWSFIGLTGLQPLDPGWFDLSDGDGQTLLHYIARRLRDSSEGELQYWYDFGAYVIRNGLDYCGKRVMSRTWATWPAVTPLLGVIETSPEDHFDQEAAVLQIRTLRLWLRLLQHAEVDLVAYGRRETQIWEEIGVTDIKKMHIENDRTMMTGLVYAPEPEDWKIELVNLSECPVYRLARPPGGWSSHDMSEYILWHPTNAERQEGVWSRIRSPPRVTEKFTGEDVQFNREDKPFTWLVQNTQDDIGAIMRIRERYDTHKSGRRARSKSLPQSLLPRADMHLGKPTDRNKYRPWIESHHRCPVDSSWRIVCSPDRVRSCRYSWSDSLQKTWRWQHYSFLAVIAQCQDGKPFSRRGNAQARWHNSLSTTMFEGESGGASGPGRYTGRSSTEETRRRGRRRLTIGMVPGIVYLYLVMENRNVSDFSLE